MKFHTSIKFIISCLALVLETGLTPDPKVPISPSSLFISKESPGAIAVGAAEGNLTPGGKTTSIYFGHIDPGNHVVNRGFCSWNKAAFLSVTEADRRCLAALQWQSAHIQQQLTELGVDLNHHTYALVNGTDLWNQSNSAGPQFPIKYKKALEKGLKGSSALIDARVEAFRNAQGELSASGLFGICATQPFYRSRLAGQTLYSESWRWQCIALDQKRRVRQVAKALKLSLGDPSIYSDPVPDMALSPPGVREANPNLATPADSPALSFEPTVTMHSDSLASPKQSSSLASTGLSESQLDFNVSY